MKIYRRYTDQFVSPTEGHFDSEWMTVKQASEYLNNRGLPPPLGASPRRPLEPVLAPLRCGLGGPKEDRLHLSGIRFEKIICFGRPCMAEYLRQKKSTIP